jgi:prepilin-type N-terminal cleavage/methylation domain-containing protein
MTRTTRRRRGFTLLEVMAAVFIISGALLFLQAAVSGALLSSANSVNRRAARELCRQKIELVAGVETATGESATNGEAGEDETYGFKWSIAREERLIGASDQQTEKYIQVTVKVEYPVETNDESKTESYSISTAIPPPKQK